MLETRNVSVFYGRHRALENVSATVSQGEIVVMLGANGAGKSTFIRAIAGQTRKMEGGAVLMDGTDITRRPPHEIVETGIALVPEDRGIFADLTVQENLVLGAHPRRARAHEAENLERVLGLFPKLKQRRKQLVRTMSGGERQMVAIGRAMMSAPTILLLDEPSLGLAPLLTLELFRTLARIKETGMGIFLVEQNAKQSLAIADRGYLLDNGHIVGADTAEALRKDEKSKPPISANKFLHDCRTYQNKNSRVEISLRAPRVEWKNLPRFPIAELFRDRRGRGRIRRDRKKEFCRGANDRD